MVQRAWNERRRDRPVTVLSAPAIDTEWVSERDMRQTAPGGREMRSSWFRIGALAAAAALTAGAGYGAVLAQTDGTPFEVSDFNQVQIEGAGHAIITIGSPAAVTVSGPQDQISNLQVQVWFNTLEIELNDDNNQSAGADLVYFAFVNYTTLGYGDVVPTERWRLVGPITAMNGVLLFGWSTAVIFEVLRRTIPSGSPTAAVEKTQ